MPAYHYIALREKNELAGIIEASDESDASSKLNQLGLSVVSLKPSEVPPSKAVHNTDDTRPVFNFEAIDSNGKKVVGTIRAQSTVKAFARLFEEYHLDVRALYSAEASNAEKEKAHVEGIAAVRQEYEHLFGKDALIRPEQEQNLTQAKSEERKQLFDIVDDTVRRIEEFLKKNINDIKPEERDNLQAYINQLMRIRESTNLDHIRSTCERMLSHIQSQELFVNEENKLKESAQIRVETKDLLNQLKRSASTGDIDLIKTIEKLQQKRFLKPIANFILKYLFHTSEEIKQQKKELRSVTFQLFAYLKIALFGPSQLARQEARSSVKMLLCERKRIKLNIQALKLKEKSVHVSDEGEQAIQEQAAYIIGWVLSFYLITYMLSYPFTIKQFPIGSMPRSIYFYHGGSAPSLTLFLFIAYVTITIRNYWFRRAQAVSYMLYPLSIFVFLLIVINLL